MPKLVDITKKYGNRSIFDHLNLEFTPNKTTVILGRSGIGKTTLLSIIANLTDFEGSVEGFGRISYIFQEPRLIPFLTVEENLHYALSGVINKEDTDSVIQKYLDITNLKDIRLRLASKLSGGEKQRVSLIRAFAYPSDTILCDEPFSSLDLGIKIKIMGLYADLLKISPKTSVMVTHSVDEAIYLADTIIFMSENNLTQFEVNIDKEKRNYGFEEDTSLRKSLYSLLGG